MENLSVVGLGKLGICTAACFASKGFDIIGIDTNKDIVDTVNRGKAPIYEPGLKELMKRAKGKLRATQDYKKAVQDSDITFLIVPTPNASDGSFSDEYLRDALKQLSFALKEFDKKYHLFVITSTVSPGTTQASLVPLIESASGKRLNEDFGVCYNPEFIALGTVIRDLSNPDLILIGENNKFSGDALEEIYKVVCENKPYIARMSIMSAEITKISLNSYITMKISFANTLANICEKIPTADIDAITRALGQDKRVSPYYLKGGPSFAGPCFPRDNKAFLAFAKKYGCNAKLVKATEEVNQYQIEHFINIVLSLCSKNKNNMVSILGLAYKPNTPVIDYSLAIRLIEELLKRNQQVIVYDPLAIDNTKAYFANKISYASSVRDCFSRSCLCVITTQEEEFKNIDASYIAHNPTIIVDCWRMIDVSKLGKKAKYIAIGKAVG